MIPSTNAFNAAHSAATGINLAGNAVNFRQSGPIQSQIFPGSRYHFEFWQNRNLYACIHTIHGMYPTTTTINLIANITAISGAVINRINNHLGIHAVNYPNLVGGIGPNATHTFNVLCKYDPAMNANIMYEIIQSVNHFGL